MGKLYGGITSQPRFDHSGELLIDNPCSELIGFYSSTNCAVSNLGQLEHFHFTLQKEPSMMYVPEILTAVYDRLRTLVIDFSTPNAGFKPVLDHSVNRGTYVDEIEMRTYSLQSEAYKLDIPSYSDIELVFLDKIVQARATVNQLESLEIYHWISGYDFPLFDCARLADYLKSGYLPRLNTISLRPLIGHVSGYGLDTSALLEATVTIGGRIQTLRLLLPEKHSYQKWLLQILEGKFPELTHLSYRLPDQHENESDFIYESRVEHALKTLIAIADCHGKLKVCRIEGNILPQFENMIEIIDTLIHIKRRDLPKLNTISLRPPIGHVPGYGLDTNVLLEAVLTIGEKIQKLQLLAPEKHGYQKWLVQILEGKFPALTNLSYRFPDRLESETDIIYKSRVDYVLATLISIANRQGTFKVCRIEGNILPQFKEKIEKIEKRIAARIAREAKFSVKTIKKRASM